ncbi:MAG: ADP-ribosylglycohydrolase family protein [Bacilli bacterium]|nr:ADP-ribosylglycohydrolase family protein [Bacilli bacterium]
MNENDDVLDIVKAGVLGFVTGDAFGVPVEFTSRMNRKENLITEMIGYGTYQVPEGTWSDDTSMTISSFDSIRECGNINYQDIMDKYYGWLKEGKYTATGRVFDVGSTTAYAIDNYYKNNIDPTKCGGNDEMSNGNGSLMRMLPIVYYLHYSDLDEETKIDIIKNYSSLTHGNEVSILGCTIYNDYMDNLLKGYSKKDSYFELDIDKYRTYFSENAIERYRRILKHELHDLEEKDIRSSGYVVDTLEACIWTTLKTSSYEESIVEAVSLGDDTDTIGAITGSMTATVYGVESIPDRWLSKVKRKDYVENIVTGYCDVLNDQRRKSISL